MFSGGLDLLSPAYHLMSRGIGRAGVPSWLTDPALEQGRDDWFAAADAAGRLAASRAIQLEALRVGAYVPCGQYFQPSAHRAELRDMAKGLPVFTGVRRG